MLNLCLSKWTPRHTHFQSSRNLKWYWHYSRSKNIYCPDWLPFWVWRDNCPNLASVVTALWNKSLSSHTCSTAWKEANINSLPKVDIPLQHPNFWGINVTPVIARCFERTVHYHYSKRVFEENLMETQYAYRDGCSRIDAFIQIQHNHLKALDDKH